MQDRPRRQTIKTGLRAGEEGLVDRGLGAGVPGPEDRRGLGCVTSCLCQVGQHPSFKGTDEGVARASIEGSVPPLIIFGIASVRCAGLVEQYRGSTVVAGPAPQEALRPDLPPACG